MPRSPRRGRVAAGGLVTGASLLLAGWLASRPAPAEAAGVGITISRATGWLLIGSPRCPDGTVAPYCLTPSVARAATGQTVTWTDLSNAEHNLVGRGAATGELLSVHIIPGGSGSAILARADSIRYTCTIHPGMGGTLSVTGVPAAAGATATARAVLPRSPSPSPSPSASASPAAGAPVADVASPLADSSSPPPVVPSPSAARPAAHSRSLASSSIRPGILYATAGGIFALVLLVAGGYYVMRVWR